MADLLNKCQLMAYNTALNNGKFVCSSIDRRGKKRLKG
jgi:hypothetical protein